MQLQDYITPLETQYIQNIKQVGLGKSLAQYVQFYTGNEIDISQYKIAIIGVLEERNNINAKGSSQAPNEIRKEFYGLVKPRFDLQIIDLGNIQAGSTILDTYFALTHTLHYLMQQGVLPIIIGGGKDLAYAQYIAYEKLNTNMNVLLVDAKVDVNVNEEEPIKSSYISKIITHKPYYLFNITLAGYQSYFVENESYDAFERMNFDMLRLGNLRNKIKDIEPICRNANMLSFSASAIRASDAKGQNEASPNGFSGEEACAICRYAGMSNDIQSISLCDFNPTKEQENYSTQLAAQMLWYFIDGYYNRKSEYPTIESKDYMVYRTTFKNSSHEIVFYKSLNTDRWWMEVPYPKERSTHNGKFMVPCSYTDYQTAQADEIPDKWMKTYQKLL